MWEGRNLNQVLSPTAVGHQWLMASVGLVAVVGEEEPLPWCACLLPGAVLPCERAGRKMVHVSWAAFSGRWVPHSSLTQGGRWRNVWDSLPGQCRVLCLSPFLWRWGVWCEKELWQQL